MGFSIHVLAISLPLMVGGTVPVTMPGVPSPSTDAHAHAAMNVNFIDRLLSSNKRHGSKPSSHRRKRPAAAVTQEQAPADTPANVPIPLPKPPNESAVPAPSPPPSVPLPETKPAAAEPAPEKQEGIKDPAPNVTAVPADPKGGAESVKPRQPAGTAEEQPEIVHEDPGELKQCLAELEQIGAKVMKIDPIPEDNGCGIEAPVKVDEVLPGLPLGGATMRCETALGLAQWLKNTVQPALAVAKPGRKLSGLVPGTTFACRLRNNAATGMISEHARGNAFDVAAFKLDDGETIEMKPREEDHTMEGAFQMAATAGACLYFTTVLAPGSDAAHETHLHVDVKEREHGYRICDFQ